MGKKDMISFIDFQSQPLKIGQIASRIIIMWILSIPCGLLGAYHGFTSVFFAIVNVLLTILGVYLILSAKRNVYQNFFIGSHMLYISVVLVFASFKFLFINGDTKIWVLIFLLLILLINIILFKFIVKLNIKNGAYTNKEPANKGLFIISFGGAVLGVVLSRYLSRNVSQSIVELVLAGLLYLVALLLSIGSLSLYKAFLQYKFKL